MQRTFPERFWSKVDKRNPESCWIWLGYRPPNGYGTLWNATLGSVVGAHRASFFIANGYWPNIARHSCDNKACVNPAHILDGTAKDNSADAVERGLLPGNGFKHWTHCKHGHEFTPENTYIRPSTGQRVCIACKRLDARNRRAKAMELRTAAKAAETHCFRGHPWETNARWQGRERKYRYCLACKAGLQHEKRWRSRGVTVSNA